MKCIIPCAGFGTRFSKVVPDTAKSLVKIDGVSILDRIFKQLELVELIDEVFVISNAYFHADFEEWLDSYEGSKNVHLICDGALNNEQRTGRIHAVKLALQFLERRGVSDDLLVIYGDNMFNFNVNSFIDAFTSGNDSMQVVFDVRSLDEARHFGVYKLDSEGNVLDLVEKPANPPSTLIGSGIYALKKVDVLVIYEDYSMDDPVDPGMAHVMMRLIKKDRLRVYPVSENWVDIGTRETYERALKEF